ncbi:MAG: hypothetical protein N3D85_06960 [Candidatus Bathyarchaeota archaeon]|nr:hypothetical protein [Candidatus Bathyarchaeota archaeon]
MAKESQHQPQTKPKMPIVRCTCGAKILLVPDVKKMSEAIEKHIKEHLPRGNSSKKYELLANQIRANLIIQTLNAAKENAG